MSRRRVALSLVVFLVAFCIAVPLAFQIGAARGKGLRPAFTDHTALEAAPIEAIGTRKFWDCYRQVRLPAVRGFDHIQDCRPPGEGGQGWRRYAAAGPEGYKKKASSRPRNRPLSDAVATKIAAPDGSAQRIAGYQPLGFDTPLDLALAPSAGGPGSPWGPAAFAPPNNLIPPGYPIPTLDPEIPPAPPIETPIPGALPLLLTGLLGLGAAARRKRRP
jgi:hypothetical protein